MSARIFGRDVIRCCRGGLAACSDKGGDPIEAIWAESRAPRAPAISASADERPAGRRLEAGRSADGARGPADPGDGDRPHASAHRLSAAQRRHSGGREQRTWDQALPAQGLHPGQGEGARRRGAKGRQPDHPAARCRRRRRPGTEDGARSTICTRPTASPGSAGTLYVANTDAIMAFPFTPGADEDHSARRQARRPSGRPDQPPLDQGDGRQRRWLEALCRRRLEQQHHRERDGCRGRPRRDLRGRPRYRRQAHLCVRHAQPDQPRNPAGDRAALRRRQRARRDRARTSFPII